MATPIGISRSALSSPGPPRHLDFATRPGRMRLDQFVPLPVICP
jgi:hypothetical protein